MKVLHVLRQLNPGGIECWLERLLRNWPARSRPEFHFALEEEEAGELDPRFQQLGAQLHYCGSPRRPIRFTRSLRRVLKECGPFQAVHVHTHYAGGFALLVAAEAGIPVRVAHSHADFSAASRGLARQSYVALGRMLLEQVANVRLAASRRAARDLFGAHPDVRILPCAIDWRQFADREARADASRFTLVHVGRLVSEKNHALLLRLTQTLLRKVPETRLWLVGDGPERKNLENQCHALGIASAVRFWGARSEVADFLQAADLFVFPSHAEGLGLAAVEAQAAGLPVLCAEQLPEELEVFPDRVRRLALNLPIEQWAEAAQAMRTISPLPSAKRQAGLAQSIFSLEANVTALSEVYLGS
jgi:glycosyltransferase involved in cell wall biosynthesis